MKQYLFGLKVLAAILSVRSLVVAGKFTAADLDSIVKPVVEGWNSAFPNEQIPVDVVEATLLTVDGFLKSA